MRLPWFFAFCGSALLTHSGWTWSSELITAEDALASQTAVPMLAVDETPVNAQGPVITTVLSIPLTLTTLSLQAMVWFSLTPDTLT